MTYYVTVNIAPCSNISYSQTVFQSKVGGNFLGRAGWSPFWTRVSYMRVKRTVPHGRRWWITIYFLALTKTIIPRHLDFTRNEKRRIFRLNGGEVLFPAIRHDSNNERIGTQRIRCFSFYCFVTCLVGARYSLEILSRFSQSVFNRKNILFLRFVVERKALRVAHGNANAF